MVGWHIAPDYGIWWLGVGKFRVILKAPWNAPLFSERYGYITKIPLGFGWRVQFRTVQDF